MLPIYTGSRTRPTSGPLKDWLLVSDPALRWQVERDLLDALPEVWEDKSTGAGMIHLMKTEQFYW